MALGAIADPIPTVEPVKISNTFFEEVLHAMISRMYGNEARPFRDENDVRFQFVTDAVNECKRSEENLMRVDLVRKSNKVRLEYDEQMYPVEFPVHVMIHMLSKGERKWTKEDSRAMPDAVRVVNLILADYHYYKEHGTVMPDDVLLHFITTYDKLPMDDYNRLTNIRQGLAALHHQTPTLDAQGIGVRHKMNQSSPPLSRC